MRRIEIVGPEIERLVDRYLVRLSLPTDDLWVTDDRAVYAGWLGRRIPAHYGGAYCFLSQHRSHAVLINAARIDLAAPRALEIVVCEELVHMRDFIDGDRRRHSHHGYDRIALRVSALTGASLQEIRSCLLPTLRRTARYLYRCPACGMTVRRRVRGTWSCGSCSPEFRREYILRLVPDERDTGEPGLRPAGPNGKAVGVDNAHDGAGPGVGIQPDCG